MKETMAIIRNVHVGNRDTGRPCLWFSVYISESDAALQVFINDRMLKMIRQSGVYDIKELEGAPCWVETDGEIIRFVRFWK